jgi:hypothetical protein
MRELWDDHMPIHARHVRALSAGDVREMLRRGRLRFVIVQVGSRLRWLPEHECFAFWKAEVQPHLADPDGPAGLDSFPGGYCYFASEWSAAGSPIVVLVTAH